MKECVGGRIYRRANEYYLPCFILKKEVYECLYDLDAGHSNIQAAFLFARGSVTPLTPPPPKPNTPHFPQSKFVKTGILHLNLFPPVLNEKLSYREILRRINRSVPDEISILFMLLSLKCFYKFCVTHILFDFCMIIL